MKRARSITEDQVRRTLTVPKSLELARDAYLKRARKLVLEPLRASFTVSEGDGASFYFMPAHVSGSRTVSIKVVSVNIRNPARSLPSTVARIYLFDSMTGLEVARIAAGELTAIRTAASSAVATDMLAPRDVGTLGILGTGRQARAHVPALLSVRDFSRVLVYSRSKAHRAAFVRAVARSLAVPVIAVDSAEEVARKSDALVLATSSATPVFRGRSVRPGTHLNAIGASLPNKREVDTNLMKRSVLIVDSREQALATYGDIMIPIQEGAIGGSQIRAEIGELLLKSRIVRRTEEDITIFKAGGLAVLDAVFADYVASKVQD